MENEIKQNENNDNFKKVDPNIKEIKTLTVDEYIELQRVLCNLPADTLSKITGFIKEVSKGDSNFSYREYFKENTSSRVAIGSRENTLQKDVYVKEVNDGDKFNNEVTYGGKNIGIRTIELGDAVDSKTAIARFTKFINAGEVIQVPLYHSGFWVTIKPPKQKDFINLEKEIGEEHIQLGRETFSLIFSNYSVVVNRAICNFIARHITEYTVKLPETENIFDYINVQDYNALMLGILSCIFPKGLDYTKACKNNLKMADGVKACNNIITSTLDPKKLLFVNRQALTKDMLDHMAQRRPDSVSLDAVKEYQRKIASLAPRTVELLNGKVKIEIENPSLNKYIDVGDKWVSGLIKECEELLTNSVDVTAKDAQLENLIATMTLGLYNSYVKSITTNNNGKIETQTDQSSIDAMLDILSEVEDSIKPFMTEVIKYISESAIAIVATPAYECPVCKQSDKEINIELKSGFDNLVPLNLLYLFFDLGVSVKTKLIIASNTY